MPEETPLDVAGAVLSEVVVAGLTAPVAVELTAPNAAARFVLDRVLLAKACGFALRAWVLARLVRLWALLVRACTPAVFARVDAAE
jgi:hypothetical protein